MNVRTNEGAGGFVFNLSYNTLIAKYGPFFYPLQFLFCLLSIRKLLSDCKHSNGNKNLEIINRYVLCASGEKTH